MSDVGMTALLDFVLEAASSETAKREKASWISASVAALMLFSFASLDWRGLDGGGAVEAEGGGARRLGG